MIAKNKIIHRKFLSAMKTSLWAACFFASFLCNVYAFAQTNDLISFFKKAISSPPDISEFIVGQRNIRQQSSFQFFEGARSGTNFFLRINSDSNLPGYKFTAGRSKDTIYQLNQTSVSYGVGTNEFIAGTKVYFSLSSQFLNMGLADIAPDSVEWNSNSFRARNYAGQFRYGELAISNNMPFVLTIYNEKKFPLKTIEYIYPASQWELCGFPSRMTICSQAGNGLEPVAEIAISHIQIATQSLSAGFFDESQFTNSATSHTHIYSNESLYVSDDNGKIIKIPDKTLKSMRPTQVNPRARMIVIMVLFITTIAFAYILFRSTKTK